VSAPLWTPSAERVAAANITAFARSVEQQWGVAAPDYQSLYNFSLTRPEAFWKSFWTFANVRGRWASAWWRFRPHAGRAVLSGCAAEFCREPAAPDR
jgi:hypothetical protein